MSYKIFPNIANLYIVVDDKKTCLLLADCLFDAGFPVSEYRNHYGTNQGSIILAPKPKDLSALEKAVADFFSNNEK